MHGETLKRVRLIHCHKPIMSIRTDFTSKRHVLCHFISIK